jgi:hypothetical protein
MTLIIAMGNQQHVVLVSDRRLSSNGQPTNDESNKAGVFACRNARLAVAYTGLAVQETDFARTNNFIDWLPLALMKAAAPDYLMRPTIERFSERATQYFAGVQVRRRTDKKTTVVLAGYCYDETQPRQYSWRVTNFEDADGTESQEPFDDFRFYCDHGGRSTDQDAGFRALLGAHHKVRDDDIAPLDALIFKNKPAHALVGKAVEIIRTAAQTNQGIGKQCNSVVLPKDLDAQAVVAYHSASLSSQYYTPWHVEARGNETGVYTIAEPVIESRDANNQPLPISVPKVGRNEPCPCRSGLKYKRCHGRSQKGR